MKYFGWRIKEWKFNAQNIDTKRQEMKSWVEKWKDRYEMREIFVNNAFAIEYRPLRIM